MKKLKLMSLIILVPIISGVAMLVTGGRLGYPALEHVGWLMLSVGVPITMLALVVVGLVLLMTGKLDLSDDRAKATATQSDEEDEDEETDNGDDGEEDDGEQSDKIDAPKSGAEREYEQIAAINSSRGYENKMREAEYMSRHAAENYKNAPKKSKVLGWLFFGFLMTDFLLIIVFAAFRVLIGAAICFCLFGGTILISLAVNVITQKLSMRKHLTDEEIDSAIDGEVQSCTMSSSTSTGGRRYTRITSVVYRVTVKANDREYTAYSKKFYDKGDTVKLVTRGNKRLATIVDPDELEEYDEE